MTCASRRSLAWLLVAVTAAAGHAAAARQLLRIPLGLDLYMPVPEDNPLTTQRVQLGRALFFDPVLSVDRSLACATCHDPARAFTDGRSTSVGVFGRTGNRSAPALLNRGYGSAFFWDGRATSLEEQVLGPIQDPRELGSSIQVAVARLSVEPAYHGVFERVFGQPVNRRDLGRALAAYVRSIVAGDSRFDAYVHGTLEALTPDERHGLRLFRGKANCTACHLGPTLTDERMHNTGVAWRTGSLLDAGRFAVTRNPQDLGAFKTPTLREIARTAPYMHDGSIASLAEVIAFYDRGGHANPHLDPELRPLGLTDAEKLALERFLLTLSGRVLEGLRQ